jgi:ribonuclease E
MSDDTTNTTPRRRAASRPAGPPVTPTFVEPTTAPVIAAGAAGVAKQRPAKKAAAPKRAPKKAAVAPAEAPASSPVESAPETAEAPKAGRQRSKKAVATVMFQAPDASAATKAERPETEDRAETQERQPRQPRQQRQRGQRSERPERVEGADEEVRTETTAEREEREDREDEAAGQGGRRRRRRGGRRKQRGDGNPVLDATDDGDVETIGDEDAAEEGEDRDGAEDGENEDGSHRRRRRRRRPGQTDEPNNDDPENTVVRVRAPRGKGGDDMQGSTRLQAKKNRRREGREQGRRRTSILTEAEFLARREDVNRVMLVRELNDRVQIAVLEDGVLVEHYVNRTSGSSMIGNVYLGRVQNVLPGMEAAFIDIGRGRNAVLYAGEVNWDAAGLDGQPKRIEFALKKDDTVLVQVTKDPVGHKGARLTSQISLPGRYLVYVPDGSMTGISRKLPDIERTRLKRILRSVLPESAGVIVRTAAEGASEEDLTKDVARLQAQWDDIQAKVATGDSPAMLYGEPDLAIKVVRDIFNEDFAQLIVQGPDVHETLEQYISWVAPDLAERLSKWVETKDVFAAHRIDEQLSKALDRKVFLPSGGSLVIDRTEAMTVVDVNTGKFTGGDGTLEDTVTQNNLEAAEEIVRQLRLRDIGGIIVVDFIDMVHEANRDKVVRRLIECLGRDRTKHQVAEVSSLGLVQMTRKRIGQGLLETFSEQCDACAGRGVKVSLHTVHVGEPKHEDEDEAPRKTVKGSRGGEGRKPESRGKSAARKR